MRASDEKTPKGITRRDALKYSGIALGGLAIGARGGFGTEKAQAGEACPQVEPCEYPPAYQATQRYSYFEGLQEFHPMDPDTKMYKPPASNEMRITFLGSSIPPDLRRKQQMMSVFVEVGNAKGKPDQFVFDCGSGVCTNYSSMGISLGRMDKIFLAHLHGDHMSDLTHIYCFGPSADRKSPLYVWGPGPSGVKSPKPPRRLYDDGTKAFCKGIRDACRWHTESFSFISTSYEGYQPPTRESWGLPCEPRPVGDDDPGDAYALVPIELDWRKYGEVEGDNVAYHNPETGVKITHFPVIHARRGSVGYKLEWNGLSMIYTSDTKPEVHSIEQARDVDVFIHEMIVPAEVWSFKNAGLDAPPAEGDPLYQPYLNGVELATAVQNSSHTPQGAFGYLLSQIDPRPRLTVATHFPVADDTVACALNSVQAHFPPGTMEMGRDIIWSFDFMVLKVTRHEITPMRAVVSDFAFAPVAFLPRNLNTPKYWTYKVDEEGNQVYDQYGNPVKVGDPYAQIDTSTEIPAEEENGDCNYREDGY